MPYEPWMVSLSDKAKDDLDGVLRQTLADFGARQLERYSDLIKNAIEELESDGDKAVLLKYRPEIGEGVYSFPVRRSGRNSRHHFYVRFDRTAQNNIVRVARVLHERMDALGNLFKDE